MCVDSKQRYRLITNSGRCRTMWLRPLSPYWPHNLTHDALQETLLCPLVLGGRSLLHTAGVHHGCHSTHRVLVQHPQAYQVPATLLIVLNMNWTACLAC